ncbi:hypothetical protein LEMLEM_LOCUS7846, partial [Lemmus lemmus]
AFEISDWLLPVRFSPFGPLRSVLSVRSFPFGPPTVARRLEPARKHATHLRPFLAAVYSGNLLLNIL